MCNPSTFGDYNETYAAVANRASSLSVVRKEGKTYAYGLVSFGAFGFMPKELVKLDEHRWAETGCGPVERQGFDVPVKTFIFPGDWEENDTYGVAFKFTEKGWEACKDTDPEAVTFGGETVTWFVISEGEYITYNDRHLTYN